MFHLEDTNIAYGDLPVLHQINLRIERGEQIALIGPSGAGKTTLLRHLFGQHPENAALIHQDYALVPKLSVFHNVYMGRLDRTPLLRNVRNLLRPHPDDLRDVTTILDQLQLHNKAHAPAATLSGGQKQRTAIARALYRGDQVLLADEPVAAVDSQHAQAILNHLKASVPTLLVSLHSVQLAMECFTRIIALREGRVVYDGSSEKLSTDQLQAIFQPC